uniref:BHLH domain-containing protein n=1 Tax=Aegilops tauschii subsp. strangulata TaxID=200361 RepID=A0A453CAJ6_AEGTS
MMMTQVANHSKRNHTDSYFSGKQQQQQQQAGATTTSGGSEEFAGMGSKKPRNASPRGSGGPISPKVEEGQGRRESGGAAAARVAIWEGITASVLQEASGYIKFLHQQLEVLSSPYMRPPPAPGAHGRCRTPTTTACGTAACAWCRWSRRCS